MSNKNIHPIHTVQELDDIPPACPHDTIMPRHDGFYRIDQWSLDILRLCGFTHGINQPFLSVNGVEEELLQG